MIDIHKKIMDWKDETVWQRMINCKRFLYCHGLLTETEYKKMNAKFEKIFKDQSKRGH